MVTGNSSVEPAFFPAFPRDEFSAGPRDQRDLQEMLLLPNLFLCLKSALTPSSPGVKPGKYHPTLRKEGGFKKKKKKKKKDLDQEDDNRPFENKTFLADEA